MNQSDKHPVTATALSVIRDIADLRGQDLPRPVLIRFAWFCIGAVFVLASVRPKASGPQTKLELDRQAHRPAPARAPKPPTAAPSKTTKTKEKVDA